MRINFSTATLVLAASLLGAAGCETYTTPSSGFVTAQHRQYPAQPGQAGQAPHASASAAASDAQTFASTPGTTHNAQGQRVAFAGGTQVQQTQNAPAYESRVREAENKAIDFQHSSAKDLTTVGGRPVYREPRGGNPGQFNLYGQFEGQDGARTSSMDAQDNLRRVTFTTEGADFDVEIDPSGQWLYFASTRHRETADIYRQRVGGTAVTQLTSDASNDVMPAVSPDGKTLAFASDRAGSWDIYVTDADGGQVVKLTNDDAHNIHPSFSRDGSQLVYCSYGSQAGQWELVLVDLARPTKKRIIGHGLFPVWSPTDDTIVFQRARERGSRWFSVWTVDIVDGEAISPTEIAVSSNAAVITPEWSPDGQNITFCTVIDPQNDDPAKPTKADVWVINRDGTGRAKLTTGDFANLQPAWSPTGDVYFISDRGVEGIENIWSVRPGQAVYLARSQRDEADTAQAEVPTP